MFKLHALAPHKTISVYVQGASTPAEKQLLS